MSRARPTRPCSGGDALLEQPGAVEPRAPALQTHTHALLLLALIMRIQNIKLDLILN